MKLYRVHQELISNPLTDVRQAVFDALDQAGLSIPSGDIAITAGSRGIDQIDEVTRAAGEWIRQQGGTPFIVPAMGSHNGATAEGQKAMLESFGITEAAMGMEIRASMDVVKVGSVDTGDVFMDQHCAGANGVLVINRIKLHTAFSGPVQSGLTKMMVVGMGKIDSARTFHNTASTDMKDMLLHMGQCLIDSGKIIGGLGLLEDGLDQLAEIHAVPGQDILQREPELVERHRHYFPRLPVDDLDLLVVNEIGKNFSGTGMDTNVIGYRGIKGAEDIPTPRIRHIAALNLSPLSQGNAIGIGLADFITQSLRDAMDEHKTFTNVFTTGDMQRMKIPCTFNDDQTLLQQIQFRFGEGRWMFIPNTLHLETLYITDALRDELQHHPHCSVDENPSPVSFQQGKLILDF